MRQTPETLLQYLLAISKAIAGQMDYQKVLQSIAEESFQFFHQDHMDFVILPNKNEEYVVYEVGLSTEWGQYPSQPGPVSRSPIRSVLRGEVPFLLTGNAMKDERFHFSGAWDSPIFDANLRSRVHVPMYVHGAVIGSLNISNHMEDLYTESDVEVAQYTAALVAPYMHALVHGEDAKKAALAEGSAVKREKLLRLGALRLTEGMEQERKRIGMDLHDQTLADVTRISRQIFRLRREASVDNDDLLSLEKETVSCIRELRRIIEDTKPGVLELFGFAQAVEAQFERSVTGSMQKIRFQVVDETDSLMDAMPDSVRTTSFRIVQEAINNSVNHGSPSTISVRITAESESLQIYIEDDGNASLPNKGISSGGLDYMRVRATLISATLLVSCNEGASGMRVVLRMPLVETRMAPLGGNIDEEENMNAIDSVAPPVC